MAKMGTLLTYPNLKWPGRDNGRANSTQTTDLDSRVELTRLLLPVGCHFNSVLWVVYRLYVDKNVDF